MNLDLFNTEKSNKAISSAGEKAKLEAEQA